MVYDSLSDQRFINLGIQFLFVTANKHEQAELKQRLVPLKKDTLTTYSNGTLDFTIGYLGSYLIAHLHLPQQGSTAPYAAMLSIQQAYEVIHPLCVFMVGIAFGRDESTQHLGDVLLSQEIKPYGKVRRSTGASGELVTEDRNVSLGPSYSILHIAQSFAERMNHMDLRYKVHVGTILSGEELIDNNQYKRDLIAAFSSTDNSVIGGEMEAVGLASVMARAENMNWLVIKAICDWADGAKREKKFERQQNAARNAVDFCVRLLNTNRLSQLPNYRQTKFNYNEEYNAYLINGYKMFYARNKYRFSLKALSKKTKITEAELRQLEEFNYDKDTPVFRSIKRKKALKIQQALNCGSELFEDAYTEQEKFFFGNKNRSNLCPPERAKAVIFDFDGTITIKDRHFSTWQKIWAFLGYDLQICEALHRKFTNGDITHKEWCERTTEYFIERDLKKEDIIKISREIKLLPGTREVFQELHENKIPIYICSGSIDIIIESVLGDILEYVSGISSNKFAYDATGSKLKTIIGTDYDFEGKSRYIKDIAENLGVDTGDIVFVGNSDNDEFAVASGAKTLVLNPKLTSGYNRKIWLYFGGHDVKNLQDILPFLLPDKYLLRDVN